MKPKTPDDVLAIDNVYYVRATSALADDRTRVLKYGDTFGVFNRYGDIETIQPLAFGLYHAEARHLSRMVLHVEGQQPLLLASSVREDYGSLHIDLTNKDAPGWDGSRRPGGTVHIYRNIIMSEDRCLQSFRLLTYSAQPVDFSLAIFFEADFADIFQVRGTQRKRSGKLLPGRVNGNEVILAYRGLDAVERRTHVQFSLAPESLQENKASFELHLTAGVECHLEVSVVCEQFGVERRTRSTGNMRNPVPSPMQLLHSTRIETVNDGFGAWLSRSESDLNMLTIGNPEKNYPYAGIPWFATVFGRDGIITALECLWIVPQIARGVLSHLALTQAREEDPARDAEPGKIVHETRRSEMARLGEVPFARYYGSADATPLFLILAHAYFRRTNDVEFIREIWPNIQAALTWIDRYGDRDRDGFVEYWRQSENGLVQQGWKDSHDSVFHADGTLAEGPIALCEIQGYVYQAKLAVADLCRSFGREEQVLQLEQDAAALKVSFNQKFWCEDLSVYALALDGRKRPCCVRASNAGHTLFTGIATPERAASVVQTFMAPAMFSGWGVRTLASGEARYNPMSYHNGSVWPHDNALISLGFSRYGFSAETRALFSAIYDASIHFNSYRIPELFCGFHKRPGMAGPTLYPVACSPQAWAAGSVYLFLSAVLGIEIDAVRKVILLRDPQLPSFLSELKISGLEVAGAKVDLLCRKERTKTAVDIVCQQGKIEVLIGRESEIADSL
ncbi:MAG: amylo-alpha-1,6-glucosidase [Candidatus Sulfotelmatobacter sp.]